MAKTRKINNALIRVFDQSSSVVYFVSDEFKLIYANEACAGWLGVDLESLIGTNLVYTTEPLADEAENAAKGLAIAPNLITNLNATESTPITIFDSTSKGRSRSAIANAIHDHRGTCVGYLVIGNGPESLVEPGVRDAIDVPTRLHEALAAIRQKHDKRFNLKRLVGTSEVADRLRRQVKSAADSGSDVLIVGPVGSGREHLARTVVAASRRNDNAADARLVPLHCSITDPEQIQATMKELLQQDVSTATLLLIDIDMMDAGAQQELLGYLKLPGPKARLIATASRVLLGPDALFDQSLASRLSTMTIEIPSLSQRREDLPLLAQAILESRNETQARQFSGFTRQAIEMICEYDWPENIAQLTSAIDEAAANATGPIIQVSNFSESFQHAIKAQQFSAEEEETIQLDQYLLEIEEQLVDRAIAQAKGNKTKAAQLLGISRAKLLRRLAQFQKADGDDELVDSSVFQEETQDE